MQPQQLRQLFDLVISIKEAERQNWLDRVCQRDTELRETLDALLIADASSEESIDRAIAKCTQSLLASDIGHAADNYRVLSRLVNAARPADRDKETD